MANATAKTPALPHVTLDLSPEEAQTLRDLIGHGVAGNNSGRRKHLTEILAALRNVGYSKVLAHDFSGTVDFY